MYVNHGHLSVLKRTGSLYRVVQNAFRYLKPFMHGSRL